MRPIDADSLMEKLNGIWDCNDMTFSPVDGCCIDADCKSCRWRETIEYVKRLVQNQTTISPWHRVDEPPEEDGFYMLGFLSRWKNGYWWIPHFPDYWMMPIEPPKEDK